MERNVVMERIKRSARIFVVVAAAALQAAFAADRASSGVGRSDTNNAIAMVNGKPLERAFVDAMARERALLGQQADEATQEVILARLIGNELFVQEAVKRGLDKEPDLMIKAEMMRRDLLAGAFVRAYLSEHPVGDDLVKEEYDRRRTFLLGTKEYSLRHILVLDKAGAREIIAQLAKGADFEALAKDRSLDEGGSRDRGGSLGWISIENGEKPLMDAAAGLAKGAYASEPVQTRFGWHVVRLDDVRDVQILPFDAVKERLRQQLQQKRVEQLERDLRASAIVSRPEKR
jgi:peptidyl-prolyl cis-trans isomerase C